MIYAESGSRAVMPLTLKVAIFIPGVEPSAGDRRLPSICRATRHMLANPDDFFAGHRISLIFCQVDPDLGSALTARRIQARCVGPDAPRLGYGRARGA
jgi:hypothetical protein